jgi:hypothetical protein
MEENTIMEEVRVHAVPEYGFMSYYSFPGVK